MAQLGIAVATYRRREHLQRLLEAIARLTQAPHRLVVAEDGGEDGSVEWCRAGGHTVISGLHRGVAWNKNRGLFALAALGCDPLLLLEDDVYPVDCGWEQDWIEGTRRWHHLAYHHPKVLKHAVGGAGTPLDPFVNPAATAQCLSVSAQVLEKVGFMDSRFQGWGHEHAEWTTRIKRAGYGFQTIELDDGRQAKAQLYLCGGLVSDDGESNRDDEQARRNRELATRVQGEPVFRRPWRMAQERGEFLAEQAAGGIEAGALARRLDADGG
jgi:glycosyltransferase involved in cell wall biosynthesis